MARVTLLVGLITIMVGRMEFFPAIDEEYDAAWETLDQGIDNDGQRNDEDKEDTLELLDEFPKSSVDKRRNRIPLEWKGLKKDEKSITQKILPDSLKMFFTRMKPKLSDRMKLVVMLNKGARRPSHG